MFDLVDKKNTPTEPTVYPQSIWPDKNLLPPMPENMRNETS